MRFEFTDDVRTVFDRAVHEANALGHDYVGTEHMLLALAEHDGGSVIRRAGLVPTDVRKRLLESVRRGTGGGRQTAKLPYTSRMKKSLEFAMAAARDLGDRHIAPDHVLLGLMREQRGIAAQVLASLGLDEEAAVDRLRLAPSIADVTSRFQVRIDDASTASIYEQIVAQVQEAIATGGLLPGERLPTVRRLADELDIAPGTVARAYGELERLGVVVTEGARGTRVAERKRAALANGELGETLIGLLRPVVVAAFHLGASADELRRALDPAMTGIYETE